MEDMTYRVAVQYVWHDGYQPDPEIYWLGIDEAVDVINAVLSSDHRNTSKFHVGIVTVVPHREAGVRLRGHHNPAWLQLELPDVGFP